MLAAESKPPPQRDPAAEPEQDLPPGAGCTVRAVLPLFAAFAAFAALIYALGCIADHAKQYG
ncbi:MAG: hypothetical protein EPO68_01865 [Planctomycetota bacterium]|nr:MAG: hypothetical protein EPO68_01865 [Planctomycetota bacterium]